MRKISHNYFWLGTFFIPVAICLCIGLHQPAKIEFDVHISSGGTLQLYYSRTMQFNGRGPRNVVLKHPGRHKITLSFQQSERRLKYLRLDPINIPNSSIKLGKIKYYSGIFCYSIPFSKIPMSRVSGLIPTEDGFLSTSPDPQLIWSIRTMKKKASRSLYINSDVLIFSLFNGVMIGFIFTMIFLYITKFELRTLSSNVASLALFHRWSFLKMAKIFRYQIILKAAITIIFLLFFWYLSTIYWNVRIGVDSNRQVSGILGYSNNDIDIPADEFSDEEFINIGQGTVNYFLKQKKKKSLVWKFTYAPDLQLGVDKINISDGMFQATLFFRDLEKSQFNDCEFRDNKLIVTGSSPSVAFDLKKIRKCLKFHLSFSSVFFIIAAAVGVWFIVFFDLTSVRAAFSKYPFLRTALFRYLLWFLFMGILVSLGVTGSSLGCLRSVKISSLKGENLLFGKYQPYRTDEFLAHGTASAIINSSHTPRFPLINKNIGLDGRNMLFLHDWGAPVKHPAILLKPATWGFFFFDLRRALSWYWLFPIFFGVFAMWFLLDTLFPSTRWYYHFLFALAAGFSPYSAVWSFWPLNCASETVFATALFILAIQAAGNEKKSALLLSIGSGYSLAVAGATLYFPHIYPVLLLCLMLVVYKIIRSHHIWKNWKNVAIPLAVSAIVFVVFLGGYLYCIRTPLLLAMNSAYPGKRLVTGGGILMQNLINFNFVFLNLQHPLNYNVCESQLYPFLFPFLILICFLRFRQMRDPYIVIPLILFFAFIFCYQIIGFPAWLSQIAGFSKIIERRTSFGMIVGQLIFLAALLDMKPDISPSCSARIWFNFIASLGFAILISSLAVSFLLFFNSSAYHPLFLQGRVFLFLDFCCIFFAILLLVWKVYPGVIFFSIITFIQGLSFNPVCIAPTQISSPLLSRINTVAGKKYEGRTLLIDNGGDAAAVQTAFAMAGGKTLTGFFCYEDTEIFRQFFARKPKPEQFHRLNHLSVRFNDRILSSGFSASVPRNDVIRITVDPAYCDFSQFPVDFVAVQADCFAESIQSNPSLKFEFDVGSWKVFRVISPEKASDPEIYSTQSRSELMQNLKLVQCYVPELFSPER